MSPSSSCCARLGNFLRTPKFKLYCSYALSSWGDRLWQFALSLILVELGGDLRLVAINNLIDSLGVLLFAGSIGRWIDTNKRLIAGRTMLTFTNITVAMSSGCLAAVYNWGKELTLIWGGRVRILLIVLAILLCAISMLTLTGTKIVLTKDWVVVMSDKDKDELAEMNAMMLRIDLTTNILSPIIAGQLMTSISVLAVCLFITAWNLCSWCVEFWLLNVVYRSVPALSAKHTQVDHVVDPEEPEIIDSPTSKLLENAAQSSTVEIHSEDTTKLTTEDSSSKGFCAKIGSALESTLNGWRSYYRQSVFPAGLAYALLFMTVLSFDGITTGYAYSLGLKENILAIARGVGALSGISGTIIYPWMRSKIGLIRTGLFSLAMELLCLLLSVGSIWLPGSPFDPIGYFREALNANNLTLTSAATSSIISTTSGAMNFNATNNGSSVGESEINSFCSIWALLVGIILARCGLWLADLAIIQIMQESIAEHERGVVNGVQNSVSQLMSMIKDLMAIALPDPRTFGLLVIASWISVLGAFISFAVYARRVRGHILPFHKKLQSVSAKNYGTMS